MGYTTDFNGELTIEPPLNEHEISFLEDFSSSRRLHRKQGPLYVAGGPNPEYGDDSIVNYNVPHEQPGLWCQWVPNVVGTAIVWDGGEKFYEPVAWMAYLIDHLLSPAARSFVEEHLAEDHRLKHFTCDHVLNGVINAQGEDPFDTWRLVCVENAVSEEQGAAFPSDGLVFSRTQVESWVGHALTDEQIVQLQEALPRSTFPDTVEAVAHEALGFDDFREI